MEEGHSFEQRSAKTAMLVLRIVTVDLPSEETVPGSRLVADRYRLGHKIGVGGMGSVYRAYDEIIGEDVALKLLHKNDQADSSRFVREVALARRVTHRNVARTFDLGFDGATMFITMEFIAGLSVHERLKAGPLSLTEAASVLAQAALGLSAAHLSLIHI